MKPVVFDSPSVDLRAVLESLPHPAVVIDTERTIRAANGLYRRRFSASRSPVGRQCYSVTHQYRVPCHQAGEACPMEEASGGRGGHRVLHVHHTRRGPEHHDVSAYPIHGADGEVEGFLEVIRTASVASAEPSVRQMVGSSPAFNVMLEELLRVGPRETSVLLLGESGTGKELAARAIHELSPRVHEKFVPVDCSGISETLAESELFGHEKGAFTGAAGRKIGLVEAAHGGTLFLDEIGDMPLCFQVKFLRLLEMGVYRRVGSTELRRADFRLVSATHRDLRKMVDSGEFRQDLYYRLSAFPVRLPPLRERVEDLPLLAHSLGRRLACPALISVSDEVLEHLRGYHFPGNIRELANILERACLLSDGDQIRVEHLPAEVLPGARGRSAAPWRGEVRPLCEVERSYLRWANAAFQGSKQSLARRLGVSERTLYRKLSEAGKESE